MLGNDKDKIEKTVQETLDWLEGVVNPITMKVYQAAGSLYQDLGVYFIVELFAQ